MYDRFPADEWKDLVKKADRREKFVELAEKRVNRAIKDLRLVGNLANRSNYSYTDQDITKIYRALRAALDEMKGRLIGWNDATGDMFRWNWVRWNFPQPIPPL